MRVVVIEPVQARCPFSVTHMIRGVARFVRNGSNHGGWMDVLVGGRQEGAGERLVIFRFTRQ